MSDKTMATSSRMGKALAVISLVVICSSFYRGCLNHDRTKCERERSEDASRIALGNVTRDETKSQASSPTIKQEDEETALNDCVRSICRQAGVESISKKDWNVLVKYIKERDTRNAAAYLLLLKTAAEAQQVQRESTRQSMPRLDPGIAAMMNYKPSYGSSSPSRSSSSSPSWKCRYCGLVVNGPAPTPNSGNRCAGRELGPDPGPHVFDKN